ncbi:MAG: glycosyltransferase [Candidatus Eremiobacteraeota bacterium]|nr:glycosyltransferase [Candidatus Eremiobacteraeota bacterium]
MKPQVSVVIPAFNAEARLGATLQALNAQSGAIDAEIIVVDNASSDATAQVAREHGATVYFEAERGPAAARNRGLLFANAPIIAHLDADTVPSRRWLRAMVVPFEDESVHIVAGNTVCYPPQTAAERYVHESGLYDTERAIGRSVFPFAPSLNMAVRRSSAVAVCGWATDMPTGEDVDFSHRILERFGGTIVYACDAVLYHRVRATDEALSRQAFTYGEGAGDLYLRYAPELPWTFMRTLTLAGTLVSRKTLALISPIAQCTGILPAHRAEYHRYNDLWTQAFWRGFFQMYLHKERRRWT